MNPFDAIAEGYCDSPDFAEVLAFATKVGANSQEGITFGVTQIALRSIETFILSHAHIQRLIKYWDTLLGKQREEVQSALFGILGVTPSNAIVDYIYDRIETGSTGSHRAKVTQESEGQVLESLRGREVELLRCENCGYHFTANDIGKKRLELVSDLGFRLAKNIHSRRLCDPFKPVIQPARKKGRDDRSYTTMHIDHVVPRAGFGASNSENLRVTCAFCNWGKGCYRFPLEGLSSTVALSITSASEATNWSTLEDLFLAAR